MAGIDAGGQTLIFEFLDALIEEAIQRWESENGPFIPGCLASDDEQTAIVAYVLPDLDAKLSENLLFDALWDRVLDDRSRELLVRAGVLRLAGRSRPARCTRRRRWRRGYQSAGQNRPAEGDP
jgi:hypothetical protein